MGDRESEKNGVGRVGSMASGLSWWSLVLLAPTRRKSVGGGNPQSLPCFCRVAQLSSFITKTARTHTVYSLPEDALGLSHRLVSLLDPAHPCPRPGQTSAWMGLYTGSVTGFGWDSEGMGTSGRCPRHPDPFPASATKSKTVTRMGD